MKVKYATQVMSKTVALSIELFATLKALPAEALVTANFIRNFNNLFDMCNSSSLHSTKEHKKAYIGSEFQVTFLNSMITFISNLRVFKKIDDNTYKDVTNTLSCENGWIRTIHSIQSLWDRLKDVGFQYLLTRRLNQDPLELFFGMVRALNGNSLNPTPLQFINAYKKLFFTNYSNVTTGNCIEDYGNALMKLSQINDHEIHIFEFEEENEQQNFLRNILFNDIRDFECIDLAEKNVFTFVCGYLAKKCLQQHSCDTCNHYSKAGADLNQNTIYCYYRAYESSDDNLFGRLCMPNPQFILYLEQLKNLFFERFYDLFKNGHVLQSFANLFENVRFEHPCENFPHDYMVKLFVRVRFFYTLKFINRNFRQQKGHAKQIILNHN